jgi:hypothetical protein
MHSDRRLMKTTEYFEAFRLKVSITNVMETHTEVL